MRDPIYDLPAYERRRLRRAEEQGRREGMERNAIEEAARKKAEYESIPEHLRRPENIFNRLIAEHEDFSYRPDVANRIKKFKKLAVEREKEINAEMADKLRQYEVENNPETKPALEHWERANVSAETEEQKQEWARLKGLIDSGHASLYWDEVAPIMQSRLTEMENCWEKQVENQAIAIEDTKAMAGEMERFRELQVTSKKSDVNE